MQNRIIIGLVAAALVGLGAFFIFSGSNNDSDTTTSESVVVDDEGNPTLPESVYQGPYSLSGTVNDSTDPSQNGTIELQFEDDNLWSLRITTNEGTASTIYDGSYIYIGNDSDGWIRTPTTNNDDFDTSLDAFSFTNEDLEGFQEDGVTYEGTSSCDLGICHVWTGTFPDEDTGETGTANLSISTDGRTNSWQVQSDSLNMDFFYTYGSSVNVDIPEDFLDLTT